MLRRSAVALVIIFVVALASTRFPAAQTATIPGTATLTGSVESTTPYTAAQVFIRNTDKRVLYMVYTNAKRFRAVALFPGNYEISAATGQLTSSVQRLAIKAGESPKVTLTFAQPAAAADRAIVNANESESQGVSKVRLEQSYDEVYPAGPGRDIAERTCMICHGENFLSTQPATVGTWNLRLDRMMGKNLFDKAPASYAEGLLTYRASALRFSRQDRETLLQYLVANFGPAAQPKAVKIDKEIPLEEAKLGKAEYIEYYLTPDAPGQGINAPEFSSWKGQFAGRRVGQDVRFDAEGNVWLTDRGYPNRLVKLDPRTGAQKSYVLPDPRNGNHDVNIDRTGMIWLAEAEGQKPDAEKHLLGFNPKTEKFEYVIPMDPDHVIRNEKKWLQSMAFDAQNNVYVGWIMGGAIAKFDRATKKVSVFPIPTHNAIPYGIIADRNDNMWIALWDSGNIAKFDTHNNQFTIFAPPTYPSQIRRLNVDAQNNIWFGMWSAGPRPGRLGKIDQTTGRITEYVVPRRNGNPYDVSQDPEGNIWVADVGGSAASIFKFNPRDQSFTLYPKPQRAADTPKIQITRDGAIWYSPRGSQDAPAFGVLYPDMDKITNLGAFYVNGPPGYPFKPGVATATK
jgi:streptogramin lyase/cytochrome c5